MSEAGEPLSHNEKLKALRQIQSALGHSKHPTLRGCGLTEEVALALATEQSPEQVVNLFLVEDDGSVLDRCRVNSISEAGLGILAMGHVAEPPPLKISVVPPPVSVLSKIFQATRSGLWDIIKIALGALAGGAVTLYLTHHSK
jgi:hypothetical protein